MAKQAVRRKRALSFVALSVIGFIASKNGERVYGSEIITAMKLLSGTLYPLLSRLSSSGLLVITKEIGDTTQLGRPLRTYYTLTPVGQSYAEAHELMRLSAVIASLPERSSL